MDWGKGQFLPASPRPKAGQWLFNYELQIAPSTYYRWQRRYAHQGLAGLEDLPPVPQQVWHKLRENERQQVVGYALEHPSLSSREIATRLVDTERRFISEATVYRILKEAGLIKPPETKGFPAGKEYQVKTQKPEVFLTGYANHFMGASKKPAVPPLRMPHGLG